MFTKFEFIKAREEGTDGSIVASSPEPTVPSRGAVHLDNDESSSCNMWHLFSYYDHDESCVDLTEVYSTAGSRARNCSTPALANGTTVCNTVSSVAVDHSAQRVSFGGSSDAHDASWLCVVNMADLHNQDSNTSHTTVGGNESSPANLRHFGTSFAVKAPTTPQRIVTQASGVPTGTSEAVATITGAKLLQFNSSDRLRPIATATTSSTGNSNLVPLQPNIVTLADLKDFRSQLKSSIGTPIGTKATNNTSSTQSVSAIVPRPILVLTSVHNATTGSVGNLGGGAGSNVLSEKSSRSFPKPAYSYSCLIAMALKNSGTGVLPVNEIYAFMTENFPYFQTAPDGWKNSVRHNLSLNKCFKKIDNPSAAHGHVRKGCLWGLNETRMTRMDEEIIKWRRKDPEGIRRSMLHPERLETIEKGNLTSGLAAVTAASAALAFSDDVLVDVYTETPDLPSPSTLDPTLFPEDPQDVFDNFCAAQDAAALLCAPKAKTSTSSATSLVRSISSVDGKASGGTGSLPVASGASRPLIGFSSGARVPSSAGRPFAAIKAEN